MFDDGLEAVQGVDCNSWAAALPEAIDKALAAILARFDCVTGSLHRLDESSDELLLMAQQGIPEALLERVSVIPMGKGMAGLAALRREPVQVCNLMTDDSGVAKPSAKLTQMAGSITLPMMVGEQLFGTLGIARPDEHEFDEQETACLLAVASALASRLVNLADSGDDDSVMA